MFVSVEMQIFYVKKTGFSYHCATIRRLSSLEILFNVVFVKVPIFNTRPRANRFSEQHHTGEDGFIIAKAMVQVRVEVISNALL